MSNAWLAVDPSFRSTGWAIMNRDYIVKVGLILTKKGGGKVFMDNTRCLTVITEGLTDAIDQTKACGSNRVYAEAKGGSKSAKAATMMAMSQAVVVACTTMSEMVLYQMLPQEVKQIVCGSRKATKDDIRAAVDARYPDAFDMIEDAGYKAKKYNEHIYDAIAIGMAINNKVGATK